MSYETLAECCVRLHRVANPYFHAAAGGGGGGFATSGGLNATEMQRFSSGCCMVWMPQRPRDFSDLRVAAVNLFAFSFASSRLRGNPIQWMKSGRWMKPGRG